MPQRKSVRTRLLTGSVAAALLAVVVIDVATVYARHHDAKPVTTQDAINRFRADTHSTPTPVPTAATLSPSPPGSHAVPPATPSTAANPIATVPPTAPATTAPSRPTGSPQSSSHPSSAPTATATPSPTQRGALLPPPGVYSYATTGGEHIDAPGGNRPFPATTNITVETNGCGVTEKWDASTQHSETRQLCLHHGDVRLASFATTVKYLGFGSTNSYTCGSDAIVFSPDGKLGQASTVRCTSKDSTADLTVTPVRFQPLEVDGTSVRTLKVTVTSVLSGANQGHSSQQLWFTTDDSVLVKNTGTVDAKQGGVDYHEQYGLMLNHLTPSR